MIALYDFECFLGGVLLGVLLRLADAAPVNFAVDLNRALESLVVIGTVIVELDVLDRMTMLALNELLQMGFGIGDQPPALDVRKTRL